ncbi:MAG: hypothetical protein FJY42_03745 [Betaproteobacteria bacterium]|nr:hypothetical protein [Betaproteobacteria bacterium]
MTHTSPQTSRRRKITRLAAAAALCLGGLSQAAEIAPYFQSWGPGTLSAAQKNGLSSATLAFGITRGSCALDSNLTSSLPDARNYVAQGGKLIISMGGADGIYAEVSCSDDQLLALLDTLITDSGTRRIDWDIEGTQLNNLDATARRNRVLVRLQAKYPDLYTSLTLPAWFRGLNDNSLAVIKSAVAAGVRLQRINAMTMSFGADNVGTMITPPTLAQASMVSSRPLPIKSRPFSPARRAQIHAMMGIKPMIGWNDDWTVFTLADAQTVADFVKANGIGLLSYWSYNRDIAQSSSGLTPINTYSGVVQTAQQFHQIFKTAEGAPAPAPAPSCIAGAASWVNGQTYPAGSVVAYNGLLHLAKYTNPGYNPTISTYYWAAYACNGGSGTASCTHPITQWVQGSNYAAGAVVIYNGLQYVAKYANPGYNPTISTYYWAPVSTWVQGKAYAAGSVVTYGGATYKASYANPGYNPTISTYYWARLGC